MKPLRLVSLLVAGGLLLGLGYGGYRLYDYTEHDPEFCGSCHLMQHAWETWSTGPHQEIACKTCHTQGLEARARIVWSWARGEVSDIPPHTQLDRAVCQGCHMSDVAQWRQVGDTIGHRVHVERADLQCLACHLPSLHATEPAVEDCQRCHESAAKSGGGMAAFHCTTCHNFLAKGADEDELLPHRPACLECHQGLQLKGETFPEHGPMAFECGACHKPHSRPLLAFSDCLACHPEVARSREHIERDALVDCVRCHEPHDWKASGWAEPAQAAGGPSAR